MEKKTFCPMPLQRSAAGIAASYNDKGAIIITSGGEGIRIGVEGLTPLELREALNIALFYSFVMEEDVEEECP